MDKIAIAERMMHDFFKKHSNPAIIKKYSRFFREGYDPYGIEPKLLTATINDWFEELNPQFTFGDFKKLFVKLLESGKYECFSVVLIFLVKLPQSHTPALFKTLISWVGKYFTNWAQVDSLCAQLIGPMLVAKIISPNELLKYHKSESKWVRRCVPVGTIYAFYKEKKLPPVIKAAEALIADPVREVGQGIGWMLRDTWKVYPREIEELLHKHVAVGNRTAYQYACEKMGKEQRMKFRRPK